MNSAELEPKASKALEFLYEKAGEHAELRAQADHLTDWLKVEKARLIGLMVGMSQAAAEAEAMRHQDYLKAMEAARIAKTMWYQVQFKRDAANAIIGAWQTCCANERRV